MQKMGVEIKRLAQENKELHLSLDAMNNKHNHLHAYIEKMKQEMECVSSGPSTHELIKENPIEPLKPNTSCILVRTNEANSSLVSLLAHL